MSTSDAFIRGRGLLVAAKRCDQCLYSRGKIVTDERREDVLKHCRQTGKYFLCHKSTLTGGAVVCRGFFDTEPNQACQVARRLRIVCFVDPSTGASAPTAQKEEGAPKAPLPKKRRARAAR